MTAVPAAPACPVCSTPIEQARTGRPARYCGTPCRQAAAPPRPPQRCGRGQRRLLAATPGTLRE
ncbi:hypothetical protein [Nonomuraea africana]|uniref:Nucleic acid-binding Zn ribbon protein n=1 Tax=Nonomuraea africana TaxID=46171 RepID=A0ABR9KJE5_9ACTN|nr:hypothetical protein [Nonomuraea africana]MBE1562143.1 putative nucleic acid-binding Zn ribbon protein [Nonomuraea africana]